MVTTNRVVSSLLTRLVLWNHELTVHDVHSHHVKTDHLGNLPWKRSILNVRKELSAMGALFCCGAIIFSCREICEVISGDIHWMAFWYVVYDIF